MKSVPGNVKRLAEEYRVLLTQAADRSSEHTELDFDAIRRSLVLDAEWTPAAATNLLTLANDYGSFMLRNALALSLALGIEDGALGF